MTRSNYSKELYNFICSYYIPLKEEYLRIPKKERLTLPFPAFCVVFWNELNAKKTVSEQLEEVFSKYQVN